MNAICHHRYPWSPAEEAYVVQAKRARVRHKVMARELQRTPRSVDEHIARMKERGLIEMHEAEEADVLRRVEAEARTPEMYGKQG